MEVKEGEEKISPQQKAKKPQNKQFLKDGIRSVIGGIFHKIVIMSMMTFMGFSTYMISYLKYYQSEDETPITLNYTYFIMPILTITMGIGIPFSGVFEYKIGTRLLIVYSSLYLILSSVIQYFSKVFFLNAVAIFIFAAGFSLSIAISGKNACMYFPKNRGMISGILAFFGAVFSSVLNIFGEKLIINPDSIDPDKGYYLYDVAKNIKKYYIFQIISVLIFTIISVVLIVPFDIKKIVGPKKTKKKKKDNLIDDKIINDEALIPDENEEGKTEEKAEEKKEEKKEEKEEENKEEIEKKKLYGLSGMESSLLNGSNYSMNQVKSAAKSFRVWRLFLMNVFSAPLNNFFTITWRPISIYKNMPTYKIQNVNSYTSIIQMFATPLFGYLSDKIPFRVMKVTLGIIDAIAGFLFYFSFKNVDFFIVLIILNSFSFFGMFALNEPHYMKVFGMKHVIEISGLIGLSSVIMGPVCSLFAFFIEQNFQDNLDEVYKYMFIISSFLSIVDIGLSFFETDEPLFEKNN